MRNVFGGSLTLSQIEENKELINLKQPRVDGRKIQRDYKPGKGGIIVFDNENIELDAERNAYLALMDMPEVDERD